MNLGILEHRANLDSLTLQHFISGLISESQNICDCNFIFYGLPDSTLKSLSSVQKAAVRLITGTKKYDHITPVL